MGVYYELWILYCMRIRTYCCIALALVRGSELSSSAVIMPDLRTLSHKIDTSLFDVYHQFIDHILRASFCPTIYSQTFENKSSLAANPVAGLAAVPVPVPCPGVTGAALLQPPKSSSAATATLVAVPAALNPPPPPGTILWFANEPPDPHPKDPELVCGGAAWVTAGGDFGAEEPHASLEPQASLFAH